MGTAVGADQVRPRPEQEITLSQASEETGLSRKSLVSAIARGRMAATLVADSKHVPQGKGNVYVVERQQLEEYLASRSPYANTKEIDEGFVWSRTDYEGRYYGVITMMRGKEDGLERIIGGQ